MSDKKIDAAVSLAASIMGRKGGLARVPKGTSMATPEQRIAWGKAGMAKRWGKRDLSATSDPEKIIENKH